MAGDDHGVKTQEVAEAAQDDGREQVAQDQPQVSGVDWEKAIAERAKHPFFLRTDVLPYAMIDP